MRGQYKVNELLINIMPGIGEGSPQPCHAPSLPDCVETTACLNSVVGCFGVSDCLNISRCVGVSLPNCGLTAAAGSCAEVCATCDAGCSLRTCGLTDRSHPAICKITHLGGLQRLKEQLTEELEVIESRQRDIEEASKPRSLEEVDALELRLNAALESLAARRKELGAK